MVKDNSDSERRNPLLLSGLLFLIAEFFYMNDRIVQTMASVSLVVEHCLEQEVTQWVDHEISIQ